MSRFGGVSLVIIGVLLVTLGAADVRAQTAPSAICVSAFADANSNGVQDSGETFLSGVSVTLATGDAIIATHITADAQYCFENLLRGEYHVIFADAPTYQPTTPREGVFVLDSGQRLTVDPFGALPVPLASLRAVIAEAQGANEAAEPFDSATRLLLATVGSMMVMLFMVGLGTVLFAVTGKRARDTVALPPQILPPPR